MGKREVLKIDEQTFINELKKALIIPKHYKHTPMALGVYTGEDSYLLDFNKIYHIKTDELTIKTSTSKYLFLSMTLTDYNNIRINCSNIKVTV